MIRKNIKKRLGVVRRPGPHNLLPTMKTWRKVRLCKKDIEKKRLRDKHSLDLHMLERKNRGYREVQISCSKAICTMLSMLGFVNSLRLKNCLPSISNRNNTTVIICN